MNEVVRFLGNLIITLAVIAVPLMCIWLTERYKWNRVKKSVEKIPHNLSEWLLDGYIENYETKIIRRKYALHNIAEGVALYMLLMAVGLFRLWGNWSKISDYLMVSLIFLVFIFCFVMRDVLQVAPWITLHVIRAVECNESVTGFLGDQYILYYDFIKDDFEVSKIKIHQNADRDENGCILFVAAEKRKKLHPIFVI